MSQRIDLTRYPDIYRALQGLSAPIEKSGIETTIFELIKTRVSQINGCAHCLDMHTKDARAAGESEQRLYLLNAWRETELYSPRERAALAWAEAVTRLEHQHVPDDVYEEVRAVFSEAEITALTLAVITINSWNRLLISFAVVGGSYQVPRKSAVA